MSLRRSARISQSAVPSPAASPASAPPKKAAALPNSNDSETKAKTKTKGATATNNKRKSRPSAETATEVQEADAQQEQDATPAYPTTPKPKRPKHLASSIPETPTPSAIALLTASSPSQPHEELAEDPDAKPRPAAPHATNAPLKTPRGSRVVAYASSPLKPAPAEDVVAAAEPVTQESPSKKKKEVTVVPPDVGVLRPPTSTVETLLEDACAHLIKTDPKLKTLIEKHHCKLSFH